MDVNVLRISHVCNRLRFFRLLFRLGVCASVLSFVFSSVFSFLLCVAVSAVLNILADQTLMELVCIFLQTQTGPRAEAKPAGGLSVTQPGSAAGSDPE